MNARALIAAGGAVLLVAGAALAQPQANPLAGKNAAVTLVTPEGVTITENDHGVANSRTLKFGEEYAPGWKLDSASPLGVGIRNGSAVRVIPYASGAAPAQPEAEAASAAGQVNLSNAVAGERPKPGAPVDRAKVQAAISAGDIRSAYTLGGSATDVAQAAAARGGPLANILNSGGEASFVNADGRTGVRVTSSDDQGRTRMAVMVPPELADVPPPADAPVLPPPPQPNPTDQVSVDGNGNVQIRRSVTVPAPPQ